MHRWLVTAGRPTNPVIVETYDDESAGESTEASSVPHDPRWCGPAKMLERIGEPPQPHASGTWSWTPAYDS
jgi:hypothetical protein